MLVLQISEPLAPEDVVVLSRTATSIVLQWNAPSWSVVSSFDVTVDPAEGTDMPPSSTGGVYSYRRVRLAYMYFQYFVRKIII